MLRGQKQSGFTIVELLIVVVVIAILAAITIVAYNGIRQRATNSAMQSELSQLVKKVESYKVTSSSSAYPVDQATAGIPASSSGTLSYFYSSSPDSFCAQIIKGATSYFASNTSKTPTTGTCSETGLLGWWKLNGDGVDSSSNGNSGVVSNATATAGENGVNGNALLFDSAVSSMVTIPDSTSLNNNPQTFSFWVKPTNWNSAGASVFLAKRSVVGTGYFIGYISATASLGFDCGGSGQRWTTGYVPPTGTGTWTHIVLTCSLAGELTLYVNGVATGTPPSPVSRATFADAAGLRLGRDSQSSASYILNGALDDVRIYNRVLGGAEALQLYNAHAQ